VQANGGTLCGTSNLSAFSFLEGGPDSDVACAAAKSNGKALLYTTGWSVRTDWSTGVTYNQAVANGWLLKDANGNFIHQYNDPNEYLADFGDPAYQQQFLNNILARLAANPAMDGVEDDNFASAQPCGWAIPVKYSDPTAWQNAMLSFASKVGAALKARGYYFMVNSTGEEYAPCKRDDSGSFTQQWYNRLAATGGISGVMYEYAFQDPNNVTRLMDSTSPGSYMHSWDKWQQLAQIANQNGFDFLPITWGSSTDRRVMQYARGTFMLDWDGVHGAFGYCTNPCYTSGDSWNSAWTADLGAPLGPKTNVQTGVWRRDFAKGIVVVNTTLSLFTVTINGKSYMIGATDALILPT
jgi:hypothetical protein